MNLCLLFYYYLDINILDLSNFLKLLYYLYNYSYNSVSDSFSRKAESNPKVTDFKMIDDKITTITLIDSEGNRIEFFKTEESFEK